MVDEFFIARINMCVSDCCEVFSDVPRVPTGSTVEKPTILIKKLSKAEVIIAE